MDTTIRCLTADEAPRHIDALADVLVDCVAGGASVSFMWPLSRERAQAFWRGALADAARGERVIVVAERGGEIIGTAQVILSLPENQPHRGEVAKVLVKRAARRHGLGARLMEAVETEALRRGKTVLVLDTVTGGDAERLYTRGGWQRVGVVPNYALTPGGEPCGTTFFYKAL
jgi:GNAT superfamily N-acetyltransferase